MDPTQFFKCLADDTRLKIMMLIQREQELCVCELMAALQESQSKNIASSCAAAQL